MTNSRSCLICGYCPPPHMDFAYELTPVMSPAVLWVCDGEHRRSIA